MPPALLTYIVDVHIHSCICADLVLYGVGYHHAGMDVADRKAMETMFTNGDLPVLCRPASAHVHALTASIMHYSTYMCCCRACAVYVVVITCTLWNLNPLPFYEHAKLCALSCWRSCHQHSSHGSKCKHREKHTWR